MLKDKRCDQVLNIGQDTIEIEQYHDEMLGRQKLDTPRAVCLDLSREWHLVLDRCSTRTLMNCDVNFSVPHCQA